MSSRGNGRHWILLVAAAVIVAVVATVVVVAHQDEDAYERPVATSTLDHFPTRGPLADDDDVIESAADGWRDGDSDGAEPKPTGQIELLWAGNVKADAVKGLVTDKDTPDEVKVVILHTPGTIATFAERQIDSDREFDGVGVEDLSSYRGPLVEAPGDLVLTEDTLPTSYEALDESAESFTAEADDGLVSSTREDVVLRLDRATSFESGPDVSPGLILGGRVLTLGASDLDRTWSLLGDPRRVAPVREAIRTLLARPRNGPGDGPGETIELPRMEIVSESPAPGGRSLLVLTAQAQTGYRGVRAAVAVDYKPGKEAPYDTMTMGREDGGDSWVGSVWMTNASVKPYLVVAGGGETETIQVNLGSRSQRLDAPGGVVVPEGAVDKDELPPVVIAGFAKDGTVVPTMPKD